MKNRGGILYSLFFCKEKITTSENTTLAVIKVYIKLEKIGKFCYNMGRGKMSAKNVEKNENFIKFYELYKSLLKDGYTKEEILIIMRQVFNRNND